MNADLSERLASAHQEQAKLVLTSLLKPMLTESQLAEELEMMRKFLESIK